MIWRNSRRYLSIIMAVSKPKLMFMFISPTFHDFPPYKEPPRKASAGKLAELTQKRLDAFFCSAYKAYKLLSMTSLPQSSLSIKERGEHVGLEQDDTKKIYLRFEHNKIGVERMNRGGRETEVLALSLFSGAGGLDIGFHRAGFRIVACDEIDKTCCETLKLNRVKHLGKDCKIIRKDIRQLDVSELQPGKVDFIIGGPPCQSFSAIGRRAGGIIGVGDPRGGLFEHYCRIVKCLKPKGFLFENVRGIISSNKGRDWSTIHLAFSKLGYNLSYRVLDAADYGVPQHRERLILVGTQEDGFLFPWPTHGPDSKAHKPHVSALEAIADLQDPNESYHHYGGKYGKLLEEIPPGMNYKYFTKEIGYPNPIFAWRSRFSDFLYKADPNEPVRTIVARLGGYSGPFHWKNRRFTIDEFKRLQSFPGDYVFAGGPNEILKQVGNSVPPRFAEQLAHAALQQLFGFDGKMDLLPSDFELSFDQLKAMKAKQTRTVVLNHKIMASTASLFDTTAKKKRLTRGKAPVKIIHEEFYEYLSPKKRIKLQGLKRSPGGSIFRIVTTRAGGKCDIKVLRFSQGRFLSDPLLTYWLNFHHPIGNGVTSINCTLYSDNDEDIMVAWDAIELCLRKNSNYQSMMDVFGHFTEPHPIFGLECKIHRDGDSFLSRFAKHFSRFSTSAKTYPKSFLESLDRPNGSFDFLGTVKYLRSLRFDVRVHETNSVIPPGYFKCCYPFTIHIDKQISVGWKEAASGNSN